MRLYIVCAALIAASCPALAQKRSRFLARDDDPEAVYAHFYRALMAADLATVERHATADYSERSLRTPDQRDIARLSGEMFSPSYTVTRRSVGATQAMLYTLGQAGPAYGGLPVIGRITLLKQGAEWRVDKAGWTLVDPEVERMKPNRRRDRAAATPPETQAVNERPRTLAGPWCPTSGCA